MKLLLLLAAPLLASPVVSLGLSLEQEASGKSIAPREVLLVLNKSDNSMSIIDPETGTELHEAPTGAGPHEVAVSPDGRLAVVCDYGDQKPGNTLTVFDLSELEALRTVSLGDHRRPHGIEFIAEREVVVTVEQSKAILRVDVERGEVLQAIRTEQEGSHMLVVDPVAQRAYVANIHSGSVSALDLKDGLLIQQIPTGAGAEGIAITPDGKQVWVGNRSANTVSVIETGALDVVAELPCPNFPIRVEATPDGQHMLVSNAHSGDVSVFSVATRKELLRIPMKMESVEGADERLFGDRFGDSPVPVGIQIEPNGKRAFVANANADIVTVLDLTTWKAVGGIVTGKQPDGMAWARLAPLAAERAEAAHAKER
jgi:YVTN family beta-propeller protein